MDVMGLQCSGCGSTNIVFDPKTRTVSCNQCGKRETYSRATMNKNNKVVYGKRNAINFFQEGNIEQARHYAEEVLNIHLDNAPSLFIMSYHDEYVKGQYNALKRFFADIKSVALEYEELEDLRNLFKASAVHLLDYENDVIQLLRKNMQGEQVELSVFLDSFCAYMISKRTSSQFLTAEQVEMYKDLVADLDMPKTCFALLKAIESNPESPYVGNEFYLKARTEHFYQNFVLPIGDIISSMKDSDFKGKFISTFKQKKDKFIADMAQ